MAATLASLAWLMLSCSPVACVYPQKNMRFLSVLFVPVFILAAAFLRSLLSAWKQRASSPIFAATVAVVVVGVTASAAADLARFDHWFFAKEVPDLATPWFTRGGK